MAITSVGFRLQLPLLGKLLNYFINITNSCTATQTREPLAVLHFWMIILVKRRFTVDPTQLQFCVLCLCLLIAWDWVNCSTNKWCIWNWTEVSFMRIYGTYVFHINGFWAKIKLIFKPCKYHGTLVAPSSLNCPLPLCLANGVNTHYCNLSTKNTTSYNFEGIKEINSCEIL